MKKKGLFLLIDALRYDVLSDLKKARRLVPNMARLAERGFVRKVVTNAQSTQFVLPSLFTQTYPLDFGGYNNGIRARPKSFIESLQDAGYETHLMASCNQLGITLGYDRGFTTVRTTSDYRILLEQRISRLISYDVQLWQKGLRSEAESIALVRREFGLLLEGLRDGIKNHNKSLWPPALHRINQRVAAGCDTELALLARDPIAVMHKLLRIPAGVYWHFLGETKPSNLRLFRARAVSGVSWRMRRFFVNRYWWPFIFVGHYQVKVDEVIDAIGAFVTEAKDRSWYVHMHVMDVHDCRCLNRPIKYLSKLAFLPRWAVAYLRGDTNRRWAYDTAVMSVDAHLGRLFRTLEKTGQMDNLVILVTGDHALDYAESPRKKKPVGNRTYYEDLEVPLLMYGAKQPANTDGLLDSMSVSATLLEALDVPQHQSFKGASAFTPGREAIISENCGSGNADLERRDIYFTVTTQTHKLMTVLRERRLDVERLFDLRNDPREMENIADRPGEGPVIEKLLGYLYAERAEIFALRGGLPLIEAARAGAGQRP